MVHHSRGWGGAAIGCPLVPVLVHSPRTQAVSWLAGGVGNGSLGFGRLLACPKDYPTKE